MPLNPQHSKELRLILPIAPNANNARSWEADTKLPEALKADEMLVWLDSLEASERKVVAVECCGPGDLFSSWPASLACLKLLSGRLEKGAVALACLGLNLKGAMDDLKQIEPSQVTLQVDAVSPECAAAVYKWVRPGKKTLPLAQALELLLAEQEESVRLLVSAGIRVHIRTTVRSGINDQEIADIAKKMASCGASGMEIDGSAKYLAEIETYLPATVYDETAYMRPPQSPGSCDLSLVPKPTDARPNIAVASGSGMEVDLHLGQAEKLLIYGLRQEDGLACLLESRDTPSGGAADRWQMLAESLSDCFCILVSHAGEAPQEQLAAAGIKVICTEDQIEGLVDMLYGGTMKGKCKSK